MLARWQFASIGLLLCVSNAGADDVAGTEFFEREVRPILAARCQACHGAEKQESDLRLDSAAAAQKGGVYGAAVVPGRPEESLLVVATSYQDEDLKMPPKGPLPKEQAAILRRWVEIGAPWPDEGPASAAKRFNLAERKASHWAWQPVGQPSVPSVHNVSWSRGPIDRFILAGLEERGLVPAHDAERRTLIRRAYLDAIGLLPTPDEVADFLADDSPDAFERIVDRLLAAPQFGERWARHWFDLVRYAETYGHEQDFAIPEAWQYRDYVIRALNADVPYDRFVMEHIAGDLMNPPRLHPTEGFNESIIATGFWFMYEQTHAPTDVRQHEADRVDNQIDVMSKAFLGITVGCARCHDHKFDAISTRDYYALAGFLKSSRQQIALLDPHGKIEAVAERLRACQAAGTQLVDEAVPRPTAEAGQEFAQWLLAAREVESGQLPGRVAARRRLDLDRLNAWVAALQDAAAARADHPLYVWMQLKSAPPAAAAADAIRRAAAASSEDETRTWLLWHGRRNAFSDWFFTGWAFAASSHAGAAWDPSGEPLAVVAPGVIASGVAAKNLQGAARSPTFIIPGGKVHLRVKGQGCTVRLVVDNFMLNDVHPLLFDGLIAKVETGGKFTWITIEGDLGKYVGERAYISVQDDGGGEIAVDEIVFTDGPPPADPPSTLLLASLDAGEIESAEQLAAAYGAAWTQSLDQWHAKSLDAAHCALLNWALSNNLLDTTAIAAKLDALRSQMREAEKGLPEPMKVLAIADGTGQDEHVYLRGSHQNLGDIVPRRFLEALDGAQPPVCSGAAVGAGSGRLELARRLTDRSNPLFGRTAVNRIWYHLFGRGIVATVDNLGAQGELPTHPELLDWLAAEFAKHGCSQKQLIRELMLSRTYQMASRSDDASSDQQDPGNLYLHRANVWRLEGEAMRDCMLAVAGRLNNAMYDPPVPAYVARFPDSRDKPKTSGPLDGDGRRSVYLEVRRNFLPPMMLVFDTPTPFTTVGRRNVSNVPAQALALLNDPLVASLAHQWAERSLKELPHASPRQRIEQMYEAALCRLPSEADLAAAQAFLQRQGRLLGLPAADCDLDPDLWSDFAHVLYNHKEFLLRN